MKRKDVQQTSKSSSRRIPLMCFSPLISACHFSTQCHTPINTLQLLDVSRHRCHYCYRSFTQFEHLSELLSVSSSLRLVSYCCYHYLIYSIQLLLSLVSFVPLLFLVAPSPFLSILFFSSFSTTMMQLSPSLLPLAALFTARHTHTYEHKHASTRTHTHEDEKTDEGVQTIEFIYLIHAQHTCMCILYKDEYMENKCCLIDVPNIGKK